jgi:hypothetical protein
MIVVSNPALLLDGGPRYRATIPPEQLPHLYASAALSQAGVVTALSADMPVSTESPLDSIRATVTRADRTGARIPGRAAGMHDALAMVTRSAAFAARVEDEIGTIAHGMAADLVLLDRMPDEGSRARVVWTMVGGKRTQPPDPLSLRGKGVGGLGQRLVRCL